MRYRTCAATRAPLIAVALIAAGAGCVEPFDKDYSVSVGRVEAYREFDSFPGYEAPDVTVVVLINDVDVINTTEAPDSYMPVFSDRRTVHISEGASLVIGALDGDTGSYEQIVRCEWASIPSDVLIDGLASCATADGLLEIRFDAL